MRTVDTPGFDRRELDSLLRQFEQAGPSSSSAGEELCEQFEQWSVGDGRDHLELESLRADVLFVRGMLRSALGDYERAITHFHDAIQRAKRSGNVRRQIFSLCSVAMCCEYAGMQQEASDGIVEALTLADELGEDRIRAAVSHSLTALYQGQGAHELMLESAMRTLAIVEDLDDSFMLLRTFSAISLAHALLGQASQGMEWLNRGLELIDDDTPAFVETLLQLNLVYMHRCNGDLSQAADLADRYVDDLADVPAHHAAVLYVDLAEIYLELNDLDRAERMLQLADRRADSTWMKAHLLNYFRVASELYEARNEPARALEMLREHVELERGLQGRQAQIRMVALERHFAADLVARTDELHHLRTVELVEKNDQLARLIEEKKEVLDVVVNDLRNPLAAVVLLTDLLLSDPRSATYERAAEVIASIRSATVEMGAAVDRLVAPDHIELSDDALTHEHQKQRPTHPTAT